MSKSPNIDPLKTIAGKNCRECENYSRSGRKCNCKRVSRAAKKFLAARDIAEESDIPELEWYTTEASADGTPQ